VIPAFVRLACISSLALAAACASTSTAAEPAGTPPSETRHFEPLIGSWVVTGKNLSRDGQIWTDNAHPALWRFYYILDGHGIQDDFTSPAPDVDVAPSERTFGTNIRIYDPASGQWAMAWIDSKQRKTLTFTATSKTGEIVMQAIGAEPPRRNIFDNISSEAFDWRQEWSFDAGKTWVPVAYLYARRAPGD
jgi:hypothetical protein